MRRKFKPRRHAFVAQIRHSETELAAKLVPALKRQGRFIVGRALIRPFRKNQFLLDFGRLCGRRVRLHRKTVTEAIRTAIATTRQIWQHGQLAASLSTRQRYEAAVCFEKMKPTGAPLTEAVDQFLKTHPLAGNSRTLLAVIAEIVARKEAGGRRMTYVRDLNWKLRKFEEFFPSAHGAAITTTDIERFLATKPQWNAVTVGSYVQSYNCFFNYAVKKGYRIDNPCSKLELPRYDQKEPCIFTVDQMRQALVHAMHGPPDLRPCIPWLAIGGFAGIRPEEIEKLDWKQVDFANRTITVLASNAKTRSRRVVDMAENLFRWLKPIAKETGRVLTEKLTVLRTRMRNAMGLARWPSDVLRHSFGSYHFAAHRSAQDTVHQMGHTDGGRMFFNHYRALVQPADAKRWWKIVPTLLLTA
jgi:integrase